MQTKQLKRITFDSANGSPELRLRHAEEAIPVLRQDLNRLRDKAERQCKEFTETFAAWTSRHVDGVMRPVAIEQDLRDARLINVIAVMLTVTELAMTFFISLLFAISAPFLFILALVSIFALKVGLLTIWRNQLQPQETRRRLRRFVVAPSLAVTMLALTFLFFVRTAGIFALLLLPLINSAICALSIGVLGLAAGLFSLGFLSAWSRHAEKRFNAIEREAVQTRRALQQVERIAEELRAAGRSKPLAPNISNPASRAALQSQSARVTSPLARPSKTLSRQGNLLALLAMTAALWSGGCAVSGDLKTAPDAPASALQSARQFDSSPPSVPLDATLMEIWLDWSLSADAQPYQQTARGLVAALPLLALDHDIARVTAYQFGDRGWSAAEILSLDLPSAETAALGEAGLIYGNLKKEQHDQASQRRLSQLREALKPLTPEKLLPANAAEPPCTDLQGVFARIAETSRPRRRLIFLLTDGHETCSRRLQTAPLAKSNTALVIAVLPENQPEDQPKDQKVAARRRPDEVWRRRREELSQAAPGAVVIPYFGDLGSAAAEALSKLGARPKN